MPNRGNPRAEPVVIPTLGTVDGRTAAGRRMRELLREYIADCGGEDMITTGEHALINRVIGLQIFCESEESRLLTKGRCDMSALTSAGNAMGRHLRDLGIKRRSKDISPAERIRRTLEGKVIDHDDE